MESDPGTGILTDCLFELDRPVVGVEKDKRLAELLVERYRGTDRIRVVSADILSLDLFSLYEGSGRKRLAFIGNIPFQITSPLLDFLLVYRDIIHESVLMVQKEMAERLVSPPGRRDYGGITVIFNYFSTIRALFGVKRGSFFPAPEVDAKVLMITFNGDLQGVKARDEGFFVKVVRTLFGWRRKQVRKILKAHPDFSLKDEALALLDNRVSFSLTCRPEELTVHDFIDLANQIMVIKGDRSFPH